MRRVLNIFNTSAKTGVGIHKGIYWLADAIQESGKHTKLDLYQIKSLFGRPSTISGFAYDSAASIGDIREIKNAGVYGIYLIDTIDGNREGFCDASASDGAR